MKTVRPKKPHNIDLARRAEIASEKRRKTKTGLLVGAFRLIGEERGTFQRVEDFCLAAEVSRGTFYKYFTGIEDLYNVLADEISADFDAAVHHFIDAETSAVVKASAAVRYNLQAVIDNPRWGWATVHTSLGRETVGATVALRAKTTIQEGITSGEFQVETAELGKSLLLGASFGATLDILNGRSLPAYPQLVARSILLSLGVDHETAASVVNEPLPPLRPIAGSEGASPVNYWAAFDIPK